MGRHRLYGYEPKEVRDTVVRARNLALHIHEQEKNLIQSLVEIEDHRFFIRFGYKSLRGFCEHALKFSRVQAQRIVTEVHRLRHQGIEPLAEATK